MCALPICAGTARREDLPRGEIPLGSSAGAVRTLDDAGGGNGPIHHGPAPASAKPGDDCAAGGVAWDAGGENRHRAGSVGGGRRHPSVDGAVWGIAGGDVCQAGMGTSSGGPGGRHPAGVVLVAAGGPGVAAGRQYLLLPVALGMVRVAGDRGSAGDSDGVRALGAGASTGSSARGGGAGAIRSFLLRGCLAVLFCSPLRTACRLAADASLAADLPIPGLLRGRDSGATVGTPPGGAVDPVSRSEE